MFLLSVTLQELVWGTQILLLAVSLYLVVTASRIFHPAIGAIGAVSAYAIYWGLAASWPVWTAIFFGAAAAIAVGFLSSLLLEPFAERQQPLLGLLASFALGVALEAALGIIFGSDGKSLYSGILPVVSVFGAQIDLPGVFTIGLGILIALFAWAAVHLTAVGRLFRGIAENPSLILSLGVNETTVRRIACSLAALIAAAVVALAGWHTALTPTMGFQLTVAAFIALLVGGVNDLRGTVAASYILALIPGLIIAFSENLSQNWRMVFVFLTAAALIGLRPHGLFGKMRREA